MVQAYMQEANNIELSEAYFNIALVISLPLITVICISITLLYGWRNKIIIKAGLLCTMAVFVTWLCILVTMPMWWPPLIIGELDYKYKIAYISYILIAILTSIAISLFVRNREYGKIVIIQLVISLIVWLAILFTIPLLMPYTLFHTISLD